MVCEVNVNGEIGKFIYDTDALTTISKSFNNKLNIPSFREVSVKDAFGEQRINQQIQSDIVLGQIQLYNFTLSVVDDHFFTNRCVKIDGLLGNEILSLGFVFFDKDNKVIKISNSLDRLKLDMKWFFKIRTYRLGGEIRIKLKNKKYIIDTGYRGYAYTKYNSYKSKRIKEKVIFNTSISSVYSTKKVKDIIYVNEFL